jgi:ribosomal-protein-alanine N-acetyltransferase
MTDFIIRPMQVTDVNAVMALERQVFSMPWPAFVYFHEIQHNELAFMGLIEAQGIAVERKLPFSPSGWLKRLAQEHHPIAAYGGVWLDGDEGHISTVASSPEYRGQGFGELMLLALLGRAIVEGMHGAMLEVRVGNSVAQTLYYKYGFQIDGRHYGYYRDNNEDAYVMRVFDFTPDYRAFIKTRMDEMARRIAYEDQFSDFSG